MSLPQTAVGNWENAASSSFSHKVIKVTPRSRARSVLIAFALLWMTVCVLAALFADVIQIAPYAAVDLLARLTPPVGIGGSWAHPLGTDELGRDIFSRLIVSLRISLLLALAGTICGAIIGTTLGFMATRFRGLVDDILMVLVDIQASVPFFLVALVFIAIFGASLPLFSALLCCFGWERYARLSRAVSMSATEQGYVEALRGMGASSFRIYMRHVLPNIAGVIVVNATLTFPEIILLESSLSFLGLGIQPPMTSLGNMLGYGRQYLLSAWWVAAAPAATIFLCTLSIAVLGDWLRDRLDPQSKK